MSANTTCTNCNKEYEEPMTSELSNPDRLCLDCFDIASGHPYECKCGLCAKWRKLMPEEE